MFQTQTVMLLYTMMFSDQINPFISRSLFLWCMRGSYHPNISAVVSFKLGYATHQNGCTSLPSLSYGTSRTECSQTTVVQTVV